MWNGKYFFNRKSFLFGVLLTILWLTPSAHAAAYPDIEGHWAQPAIERWSDSGILKGYSNGTFGPNDPVTRAQLSEILYRVWGCGPVEGHAFPDAAPDAWYHDALVTMNAFGVTLNQGKSICPDQPLTRQEAFYMVAKAFDIGLDMDVAEDPAQEQTSSRITDAGEVEPAFWARINSMLNLRYLNGGSDGALHPTDTVSRAEILTVIDNMFDLYVSQPGSYHLQADQVALITCPDVTLTYIPDKIYHESTVYLMAGADHGVHFTKESEKWAQVTLTVLGVSADGPEWTAEGVEPVKDEGIHLSDPRRRTDLRFAGGIGIACCPYLIETPEQFLAIEDTPDPVNTFGNTRSRYFSLLSDIVLPENQPSIHISPHINPHLLGNGHIVTIRAKARNRELASSSFILQAGYGLFDSWSEGECRDLILAGSIDLTLDDEYPYDFVYIGGFSDTVSGGTLRNCTPLLDIKVSQIGKKKINFYVGGLVGYTTSTRLLGCTAGGTVTLSVPKENSQDLYAGGLIGVCGVTVDYTNPFPNSGKEPEPILRGDRVLFLDCGSDSSVSVSGGSHSMAGGIIGLLSCPDLSEFDVPEELLPLMEGCWSTAAVTASGAGFQSDCGGIIGQMSAGTIQGSWARPTLSIAKGSNFQNTGSIAGAMYDTVKLQNCWGNAVTCQVSDGSAHCGGIVGRMRGTVSRCCVLGTERFAPQDAISYASWTDGLVTDCADLTRLPQEDPQAFYSSLGWDLETVWDVSGRFPILRGHDEAAQRAAQEN